MKILITGLQGTLAPHFARYVEGLGHEVVGWDRNQTDPNDSAACHAWLENQSPDVILHLALGGEDWAAQLAGWCANRGRPFGFTSSVMVFDNESDGPHSPDDTPTTQDEYGRYKARCERRILEVNPRALIVRIGWQMDLQGGGNNMVQQLTDQHRQQGHINASELWMPAASLMSDTAAVTWELLANGAHGIHHLDSNAESALNFVELVTLLANTLGQNWKIHPNQDYKHDQRLVDPRVNMPSLKYRLDGRHTWNKPNKMQNEPHI